MRERNKQKKPLVLSRLYMKCTSKNRKINHGQNIRAFSFGLLKKKTTKLFIKNHLMKCKWYHLEEYRFALDMMIVDQFQRHLIVEPDLLEQD